MIRATMSSSTSTCALVDNRDGLVQDMSVLEVNEYMKKSEQCTVGVLYAVSKNVEMTCAESCCDSSVQRYVRQDPLPR
jgi:hypothetical protein